MARPSNLDDPYHAQHAWARYRRLMAGMMGFTAICVAVALGLLYWKHGMVSIHLYLAAALGVGAAVMLAAALMGLVFLSSGTGHDDAIDDPFAEDDVP